MPNNKGYTFTEVLIAALVTAIIVAVVLGGLDFCRKLSFHNKNQIAALSLLQKKLEDIRTDIKTNRFDNLTAWNGETTTPIISDGHDLASTADDILGTLTVSITARDIVDSSVSLSSSQIAYVEVTVSITWDYLRGPYTENLSLDTIITL
jgi:hypothetical protein